MAAQIVEFPRDPVRRKWFVGNGIIFNGREVAYAAESPHAREVVWWFVDHPESKKVTNREWSDISAVCYADFIKRRAEWRRQLIEFHKKSAA